MKNAKIAIIGAGPAALAVANALGLRGERVRVIAPDPTAAWVPNYGGWADQFSSDFGEKFFEQTYAAPCVRLPRGGKPTEKVLRRRYARIHKTRLQEHLLASLRASGAEFIQETLAAVEPGPETDRLVFESGRTLEASLVIDASGARSPFVNRHNNEKNAFQLAYGQTIQTKPHGFKCGEMRFMDFSGTSEDQAVPTFLYAMPLSHNQLFVEETVLATRQQVSFDYLKNKLNHRLAQEGIEVEGVLDEEFCRIPLGLPLPKGKQAVIPFGAAAAMVHPASGYLLARVVETAPRLADLILNERERLSKSELLKEAMNLVWPTSRKRTRELYMIGLEMLTRMGPERTVEFFHAFFELPEASWRGFLNDSLSPYELGLTMSRMFALSKTGLRFSLLHNTMSHASEHLINAVNPVWAMKERA